MVFQGLMQASTLGMVRSSGELYRNQHSIKACFAGFNVIGYILISEYE